MGIITSPSYIFLWWRNFRGLQLPILSSESRGESYVCVNRRDSVISGFLLAMILLWWKWLRNDGLISLWGCSNIFIFFELTYCRISSILKRFLVRKWKLCYCARFYILFSTSVSLCILRLGCKIWRSGRFSCLKIRGIDGGLCEGSPRWNYCVDPKNKISWNSPWMTSKSVIGPWRSWPTSEII